MRLVPQVYRGSRTRRFVLLPACALALTIAVMMFLAYFPFDWNPPHTIDNDVTRTAQGDLRFGEHNAARSSRSPEWLIAAQSAERLTIDVEARPQFPQRNTPAPIMMLARDFWHTSFAIGQDETSLVLWVRRTGSTANGDPPFTVPDAFRPNHWTRVKVGITGARLVAIVDGKVRLRESLPTGTLSTWTSGRIALGDEIHGGNGWSGDIRRAVVTSVGGSLDYVRPGALFIPPSYLYFPDHITPFPPPAAIEWFILVLHLFSFILVGFLLMWISRPAFESTIRDDHGVRSRCGACPGEVPLRRQAYVGGRLGGAARRRPCRRHAWALGATSGDAESSGVARWSRYVGGNGQMSLSRFLQSANCPSGGAARVDNPRASRIRDLLPATTITRGAQLVRSPDGPARLVRTSQPRG